MAEVFFALEGEDVEGGVEAVDLEFVAAVVEEDAQCGAHGQASVAVSDDASCASVNCNVMPSSSL
ncbi:hypothetical protein D3C80_1919120 [compost metagenome]